MAGRNRVVRQADMRGGGYRDDPRPIVHHRGPPGPLLPHPAILEEELEFKHREIQKILAENRNLVEDNTVLQRDLVAARDEVHRLGQIIPKVRADKEAHIRELMDRGLKLENELRSVEPLKAEVVQLRAETQKLNVIRQDLSAQVQTLTKDFNRAKSDNQQLAAMKSDIELLRNDLAEARRGVEYEKKGNEGLVGQNQAMQENLISMAREIEKLRAGQVSAERRAQLPGTGVGVGVGIGASGSGGYGVMNGSPEMRHRVTPYGDPYARRSWGSSYDSRGPPPPRR